MTASTWVLQKQSGLIIINKIDVLNSGRRWQVKEDGHISHIWIHNSIYCFLHKTIELETQKCDNMTLFNRLWYKEKLYHILNWLHLLFSEYSNNKIVLSELFATLSVLVVRDEFCKAVMDMGGVDFILQAFQNNMAEKVKIINPFYNLIKIICYDMLSVLEMKIWIYWSESNSWIYFIYIYIHKFDSSKI